MKRIVSFARIFGLVSGVFVRLKLWQCTVYYACVLHIQMSPSSYSDIELKKLYEIFLLSRVTFLKVQQNDNKKKMDDNFYCH